MDELITDQYAIYNNDCLKVIPNLKDESIDFSIYSPPFAALYNYSSSGEDMSNCRTYEEFLEHYEFLVKEISRVTKPGRQTAVHCFSIPKGLRLKDFPGDIVRLHEKHGFYWADEHIVWKEPLRIAIKTRMRSLMHGTIVKNSLRTRSAIPDKVLIFKKIGEEEVPVEHPLGLSIYPGEQHPPEDLVKKYKNFKGDQRVNKLSHWIWQHCASSVWMDIRMNRVLEYRKAKDQEDERHVCPLMLDVIDRCLIMGSNEGDTVLTPFMGVGSEVYSAVRMGRKGIGIELKPTYFRQAVKNIERGLRELKEGVLQAEIFDEVLPESFEDEPDTEILEES
jgi:DNA modification methylase